LFGVRVLDFSIGFGKSISSWKTKSNTVFNLRILPFGGYVQMNSKEISPDENEADSFESKKYYQKILITLGGPLFNFLLALFILFAINLYGVNKVTPIIGDIIPNSLAESSGLQKKDLILDIDGNEISSYSDAQLILSKRLGDSGSLKFKILRGKEIVSHDIKILEWLSKEEPGNLMFSLGIVPPIEPVIGDVLSSSPAEEGGLLAGDKIIKINEKNINDWSEIRDIVNKEEGNEISVLIEREEFLRTFNIKPRLSEDVLNWQIGVSSAFILSSDAKKVIRFGVIRSFRNSINQTYSVIENSLIFFKKIILGQISSKNLGGPVMIGQYAGESVIYGGIYSFIYFMAFISISLGLVNLFPLPVLDGGQALILTVERIIGRELPVKLLDIFYKLGGMFLIFLFVFVFFNDIFRIIL
jgi:regulator of sigma E protease